MKKLPFLFFVTFLFSAFLFGQKNAEKFDEYGSVPCDDYLVRLDSFAVNLQENPNSTGVVIIYEGKYRGELPIFGYAQNRMREIAKHYEYRKLKIPKITYISGGFREEFSVELWFVPRGANFPNPTPTINKMEFRKGKLSNKHCGQYTG